ncbi:MAG: T9SS type A sorting domain-containing protein [Balneolaceae bacterium]|nr:T9SS type A sorting domain-containing protein [Balneolaceae bacterium]
MVRNPDGTGRFEDHTTADTEDASTSSPGTKIDGSNFNSTLTISGDAGWRMLSAPVDDMQISDLDDDIHIQGVGGSGEDNIFVSYDGSNFVEPTSISDNLSSGNGFIVYLFNNEDYSSSNLPVTVDPGSTAEPQSDVAVNLHSSGDKWNLIGNPFSTAISVTDIANWTDGSTTLNSNVGQIWDHETQSYILTTENNEKVAHWQGFFIENNDAKTLTIPVSAKTTGTKFYKESAQQGMLSFTLKGQHSREDIQTIDKAAVLYFHEQATHEKDIYDATKLAPMTSRYAILGFSSSDQDATGSGLNLRAQDSRPYDFEGELSIDMELQTYQMEEGSFTLSWESIELPETWIFTLIDNQTGAEINMNTEENYTFSYAPQQQEKNGFNEESGLNQSLPKAVAVKSREQGPARFTIKASAPRENSSTSSEIPESVKLNPNYPNPFNPSTTITFELIEQAHVELNVYTIVGQKVATLVDGVREMGEHQESWNAADMPSGIYIAQLEVQGKVYIRKMTLIK